jgi:shikimate 5-dehydrogenase
MPTNKQIQIPVKEFDPHRWMLDVLSSPARFKVLRWHRRARKTTLGLNILIRAAASNHGHTYVYVAPTYKQAKAIIVRDPMMLSRYLPREVLTR